MKSSKGFLGLVGALAVCCALAACGTSGGTVTMAEQEHVITVNATAEVKVSPDKASFNVTITTQGATADEASAANAEPTNAVIAALKAAGVADEDIQTTYTNLYPRYGFAEEPASDMAYMYGGNDIVGYEMYTNIQVTGVDIDDVTNLMGACVAAGATGVDGLRYYASTYDEAYADALAQAVTASREKAQILATAAGVTLGRVVNITEGYSYSGYRYSTDDVAMESDEAGGGMAAMRVAPGQVSIEAQVTVSYSIQ